MSTPAPSVVKSTKSRKERDKERKTSLPQSNERLKTVIRRLPPNLPEDVFWKSVESWVSDETVLWKMYYQGKLRKKLNKENIPSRAYVAFRNEELLAHFSREYDGHVFRDKSGVESQAVVEFAPYQKVPTEKKKPDGRNATIEKDEDYISFLESLKASENAEPVTLESLSAWSNTNTFLKHANYINIVASSQPAPQPKTTPLLEALKAEKSANKDREAILRNHAHYNQIATSARKEEKKKAPGAAPPPPPAKAEPAAAGSGSKKSGKKGQAATAAASNPPPAAPKGGAKASAKAAAATTEPPPKIAKPPRNRGGAAASAAKAAENEASRGESAATAGAPPAAAGDKPISDAAAGAAPTPRRSRPVIGLASRQFEAALSGVSGLAGAASERKRREKEKEKDKEKSTTTATTASGASAAGASSTASAPNAATARIDAPETEKVTLTSPKKEKTRRGRRGGDGGGGGSGGGNAAVATTGAGGASSTPAVSGGAASAVKVPSILQRSESEKPVAIQKVPSSGTSTQTSGAAAISTGTLPNPSAAGSSPRGGGGRRSRGGSGRGGGGGGGRGRGGTPGASRGGG